MAADFLNAIARSVKTVRLQRLLHLLELLHYALLHHAVKVFKVSVPAGLKLEAVRYEVQSRSPVLGKRSILTKILGTILLHCPLFLGELARD